MLATDLHYLAPELVDAGKLADVGVISSGTMVTRYTDAIADALVDLVITEKPDAFVMPGDLTYNGERASHVCFAAKLAEIADAGVPVLVIPGNHDIHESASARLAGTADHDHFGVRDWFALYGAFGPDAPGVVSADTASFSYVWQAGRDLRLLMLDCNAVDEMWRVPDVTLAWAQDQLADAQAAGARVIAFSHQNLLGASGYNGLMMANADEVETLYAARGVVGNFSGHMHGQSVLQRENGLFDVVTSALSIWPLRYAVIDVVTGADGEIGYRTERLDVERWARRTGCTDPNLLNFDAYGRQFIYEAQYATMFAMLQGLGTEDAEAQELADWFATVSVAYADGTASDLEPRPDLLERFLEAAGNTTATRFSYAFDPTVLRAADTFETTLD